ncbi:hypothetical protein DXV76_03410 [Rhodobacteraceae bacterium CCMM004]|nr:hypothetical protein DXV76_03410 [Rhodobacteraceae bacterium CCMM004]
MDEAAGDGRRTPAWAAALGGTGAAFALLAGALLVQDGLYIDQHDGDMLHLLEIVMRMAQGDRPHVDFQTPIGVLASWPIAAMVETGAGVGRAILWAQIAVAALLLGPAVWVGATRLTPVWAAVFGGIVMALCLGLIAGGAEAKLSVSMHYNRWAWAIAFIAVGLAYLPLRRPGPVWVDGVLLGLCMAALTLMKVTYVVALTLPIAVTLLAAGQGRTLAIGVAAAATALVAATLALGWAFWPAYVGDLLTVARSAFRDYPSAPLAQVLSGPATLAGTVTATLGVIWLRRGGATAAGLGLLLLIPAGAYITFQNYGNDPKWFALAGLILLAWRDRAAAAEVPRLTVSAAVLLALAAPSLTNIALSPLRHIPQGPDDHVQVFPVHPRNGDLWVFDEQALQFDKTVRGDGPGSGMEAVADAVERRGDDTTLMGEPLAYCAMNQGLIAWMQALAADLRAQGFADGSRILAADLLSSFWLFDEGLLPVPGAAPWIYGGLPGIGAADYVLVPTCPVTPVVRKHILDELAAREIGLTEVHRGPLYILLAVDQATAASAR